MDWNEIGKRIRRQREFFGWTREDFAEIIDVTPKFCSDIELGVKGMSVQTLCKISKALSLSLDYIIFGDKEENSFSIIADMIKNCPSDKYQFLEDIIKSFMLAVDKK